MTWEDLEHEEVETNSHSLEPDEFFPVLPVLGPSSVGENWAGVGGRQKEIGK